MSVSREVVLKVAVAAVVGSLGGQGPSLPLPSGPVTL